MKLSVIISTYNSPEWLEKVLWGYLGQIHQDFELLIADDGSTLETAEVTHDMQRKAHFPIRHIWQEDHGFNKCKILNKAIIASGAEYLIFSDGDCIPRRDFLVRHLEMMRRNCFLLGGAVRLPLALSHGIKPDQIISQEIFNRHWLLGKGLKKSAFKNLKLTRNRNLGMLLNRVSPTKATWNGGNSSAWKKDVLEVNGFDERMRYGAEDREFGERLIHLGLTGLSVRYSAVCLHLEHTRGYVNEYDLKRNLEIRKCSQQSKAPRTPYGIIQDHDYKYSDRVKSNVWRRG